MSATIEEDYKTLTAYEKAALAVQEVEEALEAARRHREHLAANYLARGSSRDERRARQRVLGGIIRETSRT